MRLLTSGLIVTLLILSLYLLWSSDNGPIEPAEYQKQEKPVVLQNPDLTDFEKDRLTMRIQARKAHLFENEKLTLLFDVDGTLYPQEKDRNPTLIHADSGTIKESSQLVTLRGNVTVLFGDGQKLYTQEMNLDRKRELLYNQVDVTAISEEDRVVAKSMTYDMKTGVLVLTRPNALINAGKL